MTNKKIHRYKHQLPEEIEKKRSSERNTPVIPAQDQKKIEWKKPTFDLSLPNDMITDMYTKEKRQKSHTQTIRQVPDAG